jgi:hypothetical protein
MVEAYCSACEAEESDVRAHALMSMRHQSAARPLRGAFGNIMIKVAE